MRSLVSSPCPVEMSNLGDKLLNVSRLQDFYHATTQSFQAIQSDMHELNQRNLLLVDKLQSALRILKWIEAHTPETLDAFKAHDTVTRTFDKADRSNDAEAYAEAQQA